MIPSEILDYYREGKEEHRLASSPGRLERIRTWEILERLLPAAPSRVLDIGGGTGVYALPLASRGYRVHLIDPVPLHIERANALSKQSQAPLEAAVIGDVQSIGMPEATFDAVLLFGPLYHLTNRRDRIDALIEARKVLVPGGLLLCAYISRFASACDGIKEGSLRNAAFAAIVERDLTDGIHQNATGRVEWFTTAYLHRPDEIHAEVEAAGLRFEELLAVEGPGWMSQDLDAWLDDPIAQERLLHVLRRVESEPSLMGASAHLIASARRPPNLHNDSS